MNQTYQEQNSLSRDLVASVALFSLLTCGVGDSYTQAKRAGSLVEACWRSSLAGPRRLFLTE